MIECPNKEKIQELKEQYPAGTVVILDEIVDAQAPPIGIAGLVTTVMI